MPEETYRLCRLDAIPEHGVRGCRVETPDGPRDLVLARQAGRIYGYLNRCPHTGVNLDWVPGRFQDSSGRYLQCATHGALFRIHDGFCIHGPCANQSLQAITLEERGGELVAVLETAGPEL